MKILYPISWWAALAATWTAAASAGAKEAHFEALKFKLISEHIRCTTCHASREDTSLTLYGQKIADLGKKTSVPERVRKLEKEIPLNAKEGERKAAQARVDIDGDGVPNWIEILSGRDPSVAEPAAQPAGTDGAGPLTQRVTELMKCTLCHIRVDAFGIGKSRAPHNVFGKSLTEFDSKGHRLFGSAAKKADAEDVNILKRLEAVNDEDADKDEAANWDEIRTFHNPADAADRPTSAELKALGQEESERRKSDEGFGKIHADKQLR